MEKLLQDLRYGFRMLLKSPGFTAAAVLALALGIGANTAIFSVVDAILLRPLPYPEPDRLMVLREFKLPEHPEFPIAPGNFLEWQNQSLTFEYLCAYRPASYNLVSGSNPQRIQAARVSAGLITALGTPPASGRDFLTEEDQEGRGNVVVLSHGLWQRQFGADPNIIGQTIALSGVVHIVVGVMPPSFRFPDNATELWTPLALDQDDRNSHGAHWLSVIGRTKPGVSPRQAQDEMTGIARALEERYPDTGTGWGITVTPMLDYAVQDVRPALLVILGAVAFVLLIACANVANLLLARAATRQREFGIRVALGSSRWRIVRQLLTESVLLALVGGGAGLLLAAWGVEALMALAPEDLPRVKDVSIDSWALLFTLGITTVTGLGFGIVPALQASRPDLNETLKDAGRGSTAGARKQRARSILVIAEVALALVVLVCGGLLMRSFWRLQQVEPGFNPKNVLTVRLFLPESKYLEKWRSNDFYNKLIGKVSTLPGVQSVGGSNVLPVTDPFYLGVVIEGRPRVIDSDLPKTNYFAVTPDYFKAMGIPLMRGRVFNEHDTRDSRRVVIINDTMARRYFPDEDPIGKRIHITMGEEIFREIVGIVGDVKQGGLDHATEAQTYEPFSQEPDRFFNLVVRTEGDPASLGSAIRAKVLEIDSEQPVSTIQTMEQVLAASVARQRFSTIVLCIFASVALVLTAVGIYGVISYSVTQRTHELGIRMAMGAQRSDVIRLVVGHGALLAITGVSIGLVVALALTRVMEGLLFGVSATDPLTFAAISALLIGVALAACFVPARRATRVDPMAALRCE